MPLGSVRRRSSNVFTVITLVGMLAFGLLELDVVADISYPGKI